jgi:hypothetical protein
MRIMTYIYGTSSIPSAFTAEERLQAERRRVLRKEVRRAHRRAEDRRMLAHGWPLRALLWGVAVLMVGMAAKALWLAPHLHGITPR